MTDIFISYASEDRERTGKLAEAFEAVGWSVWWDRRLIVGQAYDQAIERELKAAKSVVVLWSKHSIESEWVRNEAAVGAGRGVLIPASLESVEPPLEFRRKQTADLIDWNGEPSHSGFQAVCEGIASVIGGPALTPLPLRAESTRRQNHRWISIGIAVLVLVLGFGLYRLNTRDAPAHTSVAQHEDPVDLLAGTYLGSIISDSKGSSRTDVLVTITRLERTKIRITSDNARIGNLEVDLTRPGDSLLNAGGDSTFIGNISKSPPEIQLTARGEVAYAGTKQQTSR